MKLYSALDNYGGYPFNILWPDVKPVYFPEDIDEPGILVLWGGEDISPCYYGEKPNSFTDANDRPSSRDRLEGALIHRARDLDLFIIGICRGAQFMCCFNGGKLIQHVDKHAIGKRHKITINDGRVFDANSLHHQMMLLDDTEHELIAWSKESTIYIGENDQPIESPPDREPEVVYFPQTKTIAIQGHPEFIHQPKDKYVQYCLEIVRKYVAD